MIKNAVLNSLVVAGLLLIASPIFAQPCTAVAGRGTPQHLKMHFEQKPPLELETFPDAKFGLRFIITNNFQVPLTAFVLDYAAPKGSLFSEEHDALSRFGLIAPIPRGLSSVGYMIPTRRGEASEPKVLAAQWEDGSSYGPPDQLAKILAIRKGAINGHADALSVLKKGLANKWIAQQYIDEIQNTMKTDKDDPIYDLAISSTESTIRTNKHGSFADFERVIQHLVEVENHELEMLQDGLIELPKN